MKRSMEDTYIFSSQWILVHVHFARPGGIQDSNGIGLMTPTASINDLPIFLAVIKVPNTAATV